VDGLTGGTMVRLRSEAIERYRVDYVAGFSAAGFSYFLTNQRERFELTNSGLLPTVSGDLSSRIVQVSTRAYSEVSIVKRTINQSIRALMQVDKPQRDRVNEYITVPC